MRIFRKKKKIEGYIALYGLENWWSSQFSKKERNYIVRKYSPMGMDGNILIKGAILDSNQTVMMFLTQLASWFDNKKDRMIANKILIKASSSDIIADLNRSFGNHKTVIDKHMLYTREIQTFYKQRNKSPIFLQKTISACEKQIDLALDAAEAFKIDLADEDFFPSHNGYTQLAIIKEKEKKYGEVINLCSQAKKQGWRGDWDKRIARCSKKISREK